MAIVTREDNGQQISLHYEVIGEGEPIVFHHGTSHRIDDWHTLGFVDQLSSDFQLILIDSRGYGKSSKPHDPESYSLKSRADDTIAVLDALGLEQVHCLGASAAGAMCFILARFHPERFKSYIFATPGFTQYDEKIQASLLKGSEAFVTYFESLIGGRISNEKIRTTFLANDAKAVWASNASKWFDYHDYVKYIKQPSLIYVGSKEPTVDAMRELDQLLPANRLEIFPDVDHITAYWDAKLVAPVIREFIQSQA